MDKARPLALDFGPDAPAAVTRSAILSDCGLYRYSLRRVWDIRLPAAVFCMLNPSKADGGQDDPTVRKCLGFARRWGCGVLVVVNLYAWRSTESKGIGSRADHVGPFNDLHIQANASAAGRVVCAWGPKPYIKDRARRVLGLIREAGATPHRIGPPAKDGSPCHPLMLAYSRALEPMFD